MNGINKLRNTIFISKVYQDFNLCKKKIRTEKVNEVVSLLINTNKALWENNNGQSVKNFRLPIRVTPEGLPGKVCVAHIFATHTNPG